MASSAISSSDFTSILSAVQQQISVATIVEVLAVGAGAAIGLVFMWWGAKKLVAMLMSGATKGFLKIK